MSKKILVTGGTGYIGSHTVRQLGEAGYQVIVYDNLSTGSAKALLHGSLIVGDLTDENALEQAFTQHKFDAVLHFAASISVPDSVVNPLDYYANNTRNTLNLLRCCQKFGVNKFVFSSTAAVYGEPQENPVSESCATNPINPYGCSKLMSERMIRDYGLSSNFKYVPACVIACGDRLRQVLGWQPKYNDLEIILNTTFTWEKKKHLMSLATAI